MFQDGTFSLADFTDAYQENEVQRVIRAYENSISIDVHCSTSGGGEWAKLPEMPFVKYCKIRVNPTDILDSGSQAIKDFIGKYNSIIRIDLLILWYMKENLLSNERHIDDDDGGGNDNDNKRRDRLPDDKELPLSTAL